MLMGNLTIYLLQTSTQAQSIPLLLQTSFAQLHLFPEISLAILLHVVVTRKVRSDLGHMHCITFLNNHYWKFTGDY